MFAFFRYNSMTESVRLATHLASLIGCSHSEAERYIESGGVLVDGKVVEEPGYRVRSAQAVALAPGARAEPVSPMTVLFNKPAGMSTNAPAEASPDPWYPLIVPSARSREDTGERYLNRHRKGLAMLTPLETGASGLVVLSQDHRIKRKLAAESDKIEHEYVVEVEGALDEKGLAQLNLGLRANARPTPVKVSWQNETRLRFAIKGAEKGLIADLCDQVNVAVISMRRIRIGRMPLAQLPEGQWRFLRGYERF
jgi:23S rRNA pseudouridine2604 synthase